MSCATITYIHRKAEELGGGNDARMLVASIEIESLETMREQLLAALQSQHKLMQKLAEPLLKIDSGLGAVFTPYVKSVDDLLDIVRADKARVGA